ncbi:MAG: MFS transporter [Clostridia bacterium]|nr:MFS transporter [Clostridia bacterium]
MRFGDRLTRVSCCVGFVTQAVIINLAPLYFVIFRESFGISTGRLSLLITVNFLTQLLTDLFSVRFSTVIGLKRCAVAAHIFCAAGLVFLAFLPRFTALTYSGMLFATVLYSIGGGLLETVINPIFSALPQKEGGVGLAFMHSFYCWGHLATVLLTTLFLKLFGESAWWVIALGWAAVPTVNTVLLALSPVHEPTAAQRRDALSSEKNGKQINRRLVLIGIALSFVMITAAGATEQAMSQWASYFSEIALSLDKTTGDLLGVSVYAFLMGAGRMLMGIFGKKLGVYRAILISSILATVLYLIASLSPSGILSLGACALTGLSVAVLWPSVLDLAGESYGASARIFGMLSLFGDMGCLLGPSLAGEVADLVEASAFGQELAFSFGMTVDALAIRMGLLVSTVFPILLLLALFLFKRVTDKKQVIV